MINAVDGEDEIELKTTPADFRFPTTNQTRHCFTRYIEFHRCVAAKGDESGDCQRFARLKSGMSRGKMELFPDLFDFLSMPSIQYLPDS
ncbi:cytochrome c oxidase subunit 6b-2 [Senna tora]|uniref:Cytochrome c oxidase subunit 6b-2 n=1 Tax=Senna tora TaxID=362788 RepID=A0A834X5B8_9FABA|nr:cytochrome c oxidase subunit 6b-2 [Senna tora]